MIDSIALPKYRSSKSVNYFCAHMKDAWLCMDFILGMLSAQLSTQIRPIDKWGHGKAEGSKLAGDGGHHAERALNANMEWSLF